MERERAFPLRLLNASPEERVAYFREKKLAHKHLAEAKQKIMEALSPGDPCSLILVYGPTGVGKTTLATNIGETLKEEDKQNPGPPGHIPVASIEVVASTNTGVDWRDYLYRSMEALDEPLINRKIDPEAPFKLLSPSGYLKSKRSSSADLRRALESALIQRKPKAFIVDEAQHLKKLPSGKRLIDQMDTLKSLANLTGIKHILFGTFELLDLADLSAQLNRRTSEIHLPRYRMNNREELEEFLFFLSGLEEHLPMPERTNLSESPLSVDFIYERSAGCPGILKDWMTRALALAIRENATTIDISHMTRTSIPDSQLARIAREIMEGENRLKTDRSSEIRSLLGMAPPSASTDPSTENPVKTKKRGFKPGTRKPSRDKIGISDPVITDQGGNDDRRQDSRETA